MPTADFENKDKRIAWLSIFSSLCDKDKKSDIGFLVDKAFEIVDKLYKKFPFPYFSTPPKEKIMARDEIVEEGRQENLEREEKEKMEQLPTIEVE